MIFPSMAQDEWEFGKLLDEIAKLDEIESILEIGVWSGGTLARFGNSFPFATLVGIDPAPQLERWNPEWGEVHFVYGKSQDNSVRGQALTINQHRKFSIIHIDGDHEYDAVHEDWTWAASNARKMIIFHDIIDSNNDMIQVWQIWNSIHASPMWRTKEITRHDSNNYGIGIVYL
jgi:hypothetical protein